MINPTFRRDKNTNSFGNHGRAHFVGAFPGFEEILKRGSIWRKRSDDSDRLGVVTHYVGGEREPRD
jgi:hypothetical protein